MGAGLHHNEVKQRKRRMLGLLAEFLDGHPGDYSTQEQQLAILDSFLKVHGDQVFNTVKTASYVNVDGGPFTPDTLLERLKATVLKKGQHPFNNAAIHFFANGLNAFKTEYADEIRKAHPRQDSYRTIVENSLMEISDRITAHENVLAAGYSQAASRVRRESGSSTTIPESSWERPSATCGQIQDPVPNLTALEKELAALKESRPEFWEGPATGLEPQQRRARTSARDQKRPDIKSKAPSLDRLTSQPRKKAKLLQFPGRVDKREIAKAKSKSQSVINRSHSLDSGFNQVMPNRRLLDLSTARECMKHVDQVLRIGLREGFSKIGLPLYEPAEFVVEPRPNLAALYKTCFGDGWQRTVQELSIQDSSRCLDVAVALVGAAIYSEVFLADQPWDAGNLIKFQSSRYEDHIATLLEKQGMSFRTVRQDAAINLATDPRHHEEVVRPRADVLACNLMRPLRAHLDRQARPGYALPSTPYLRQISEVISQGFEETLILREQLHAHGQSYDCHWHLPFAEYDPSTLTRSSSSESGDVDKGLRVATTVMPQIVFHLRNGQSTTASRALVNLCS